MEGAIVGRCTHQGTTISIPIFYHTTFSEVYNEILEPQQRTITFISDRHKGLIPAVTNTFPDSPHAYCLHHIKLNILEKYPASLGSVFRNKIVQKFSECAYAATPEMYELKMAALVKEGGNIMRKFLKDLPKENFCNAFFKGKSSENFSFHC
ncbi:hypothetical protein DVH24_016514 [Malus domestica]|uniref:MULE transposase domain-containing protein n=1 Tax=Malus domestica TaxID=3750 RepID=A0A498HUM9_MALDO|nr:hypothetical protein DVH24_016514 [Malus domestica]